MRHLSLFLLLTLLAISLLSLPVALAASDDLYDYEELTLQLALRNQLLLVAQGERANVDYVTADLSWWPRDTYRQRVQDLATLPQAEYQGSVYSYYWKKPTSNRLDLELRAVIGTSNEPFPIRERIPFPIASLPSDVAAYTEFQELIDTDEAIQEKALELADGKEDLFEVVATVAEWVTSNIAYNLTSVTAEATEPSSWVMANRQGVCDEMTALFISMLRNLGIPARFVSGISYTNLPEFASPWGGHGWAEVWFPDTGWVPFDVTYGTYGYVDATHIKLQDAADAGKSSVDFTMRAREASLVTQSLDMDVEVLGRRHLDRELFTVELEPFDDVSLSSHNLITATVMNGQPFYLSARFSLAPTEGLELVGSPDRSLLLHPYETKRLRFLVRTQGLSQGFRYTFPVKLYGGMREVAATSFEARQGLPSYGQEFFASYLESTALEQPSRLRLSCGVSPEKAYVGGSVEATCTLENLGRSSYHSVKGCIETCTSLDLGPEGRATFDGILSCVTPGAKAALASAKASGLTSTALVRYACLDEAEIEFEGLSHPDTLAFDEEGEITFQLRKGSDSVPEQVRISVIHDNFLQEWESDELLQPQKFTYTIHGHDLDLSGNEVRVVLSYQDELGKAYETTERFTIEPAGFTFFERLQVRLQNIERWLEGLV